MTLFGLEISRRTEEVKNLPASDSIVPQLARDRLLELIEREQLPRDVNATLSGALTGDGPRFQLLVQAMFDTWPHLQKAVSKISGEVSSSDWIVEPCCDQEGERTDKNAEDRAALVRRAIKDTRPRAAYDEGDFKRCIEDIVFGYFSGCHVESIDWYKGPDGEWLPRSFRPVPPRFYGYPHAANDEDRLVFYPGGQSYGDYIDFPEHRFLLGLRRGHPGHPATAAPIRSLVGYWLAAVYGLRWLMEFSQTFGQPIRIARSDDPTIRSQLNMALKNIGARLYGVIPTSAKIEILESSKSASALPQYELIKLADQQCDNFILGQTLTSGTDGSGSRALGEVHERTGQEVTYGVATWVAGILTNQLGRSVLMLNFGDDEHLPTIRPEWPDPVDELKQAQRDEILRRTYPELDFSLAQIRDRHAIKLPIDEEDTLRGQKPAPKDAEEQKDEAPPKAEKVAAARAGSSELGTVDDLAAEVLQGLTGVSVEWLAPVRQTFEELMDLAESGGATDDDFTQALESAQRQFPELFDVLDTQALKDAFTNAIGTAAAAGSADRYIGEQVAARYDPNQPRAPKGESGGGRWTSTGRGEGLGKGRSATTGKMRAGTDEERKKYKVPPAYKDFQVTDDPDADLVGTATKPNGDPWPVYSEKYKQQQKDAKWGRVSELDSDFDTLSDKMDSDIAEGGRDAESAAALRLIRQTALRNGGEGRTMVKILGPDDKPIIGSDGKPLRKPVTTYGASSLRGTHIKVEGDRITMDFPGKDAVAQHIELNDSILADVMRPKAGKDEKVFDTNDARTLRYLGRISDKKYKVHDFRTLNATQRAESIVNEIVASGVIPKTEKEFNAMRRQVAVPVSEVLGNSPTVALENYIHPDVFNALKPK